MECVEILEEKRAPPLLRRLNSELKHDSLSWTCDVAEPMQLAVVKEAGMSWLGEREEVVRERVVWRPLRSHTSPLPEL